MKASRANHLAILKARYIRLMYESGYFSQFLTELDQRPVITMKNYVIDIL